jgi:amino acid adenylation domain-containing protein
MGDNGMPGHACGGWSHAPLGPHDADGTLTARFEAMAEAHAACAAVCDRGATTTYAALARHAAGVAAAAEAAGLRPGDTAALLLDQGEPAVAAMLGTLRAGAAFAPLDLLDPPGRAAELLGLAGARVLLTTRAHAEQAHAVAARAEAITTVIAVDDLSGADGGGRPPAVVDAGAAASVFFTSGSTGAPKAVLDLHRNVLHNAYRYTTLLQLGPADRLSLVQRPSFSGIASSLFGALLNGATLCTYPLTADNLHRLAEWVDAEGVTVFHSVPAIFRALVADGRSFPQVRVVRLEGDRASWSDVSLFRRHFPPTALLANGLGTTETGLASQFRVTAESVLEHGILPVGSSTPGVEVVVLGESGEPLAAGEVGEIAVRSRFLAAGYVGAPELTASRFTDEEDGLRRYRTGDLGRVGAGGRLEYLGRVDGAFKVAGTRVEPAEVEAALLRVTGVAEAAATIEEARGGGGRLVAQVVAGEPGLTEDAVRDRLSQLLPAAMIPARIAVVERIAVDANWKLARRSTREPQTEAERVVRDVWAEVLEVDVGLDDTFVSLGGDSLSAAGIAVGIERRLGVVVPPSLFARAPTVARLAAALTAMRSGSGVDLVVLSEGTAGVPLLLVPDASGRSLMYGSLARAVDPARPVWALELSPDQVDDLSVPSIVALGIASLRAAQARGPYALGGFCYGGLIAIEMARRLRLEGEEALVVGIALEPGDLPQLVAGDAVERWASHPTRRVGHRHVLYHLRRALQAPRGERRHYLAMRTRNVAGLVRRGAFRRRVPSPLSVACRGFRAASLPGSLTIVLGAETAATYTDDAAATWAPAADAVDVRLLPGNDVGLVVEPTVRQLAAALDVLIVGLERGADRQTVP